MIVRYHMKLGHPAKAIIEIQGRFRFSAPFYGRKGRGKLYAPVLISIGDSSITSICSASRSRKEAERKEQPSHHRAFHKSNPQISHGIHSKIYMHLL